MLKRKLIILIVFFVSVLSINYVYSLEVSDNLIGKIIYIDPGHGGADPGAVYKNVEEAAINLIVSKKLKENLENLGASVYITREGDYDLSSTTINRKKSDLYNRINLINKSNCDVYISIHINAESSSLWYGAQTFYYPANKRNIVLAKYIQKSLIDNTSSKREVSRINDTLMYTNIKVPGVLIELGFITNYQDRLKLNNNDYQNNLVSAISSGLIEYFKS
jgi:N-acetylmuramoyl-L-alanine amidase